MDNAKKHNARFVGVIDPNPPQSDVLEWIKQARIPVYPDLNAFYAQSGADLLVISSPIQFHKEQSDIAFANGSHVLCEKPIAGSSLDGRQMEEMRGKFGKLGAVGFQWCFEPGMLELKEAILSGEFGAALKMSSIVLWPRNTAYYKRGSGWAGKKRDTDGRTVNDSVASNATAHYLMNMLWLLGDSMGSADRLLAAEAQALRVNLIETYDTLVLRGKGNSGAAVQFVVSHAAGYGHVIEPKFEYKFEKATIICDRIDGGLCYPVAQYNDGRVSRRFAQVRSDGYGKVWHVLDAIRNHGETSCSYEAALAHAEAIELIDHSCPKPKALDGNVVHQDAEHNGFWIPGLATLLVDCYEKGRLPAELGNDWFGAYSKIGDDSNASIVSSQ